MNNDTQKDKFRFVEYSADAAERIGYSDYSYWKSVFQNFFKKKSAVVMAGVFFALVIFSFIALSIGKYNYSEAQIMANSSLAFTKPNSEFWFGTDNLGRDYWCQVWYAAQVSIKLALIVAAGECVIGVIIGSGNMTSLGLNFGNLILRVVGDGHLFLGGLMVMIMSIILGMGVPGVALVFGQSFRNMALAMIAFGWLVMARNVRNLVLMYRDREYNLASRCLGTPVWRILLKNIFPYLISVVILRLALSIPQTIALESTLSYLGLGLDVNTPSLGILLRNARNYFLQYPYLLVFPAVIVSLITITFYLVGNAFSDAADPRNHV